jgi:hypothetical protein
LAAVSVKLLQKPDLQHFIDDFAGGWLAQTQGLGQFRARRRAQQLQSCQQSALVQLPHFGRHEDHNT